VSIRSKLKVCVDDEISHHRFLNNYLQSKGAAPVDLSRFAILPPSQVTGVPQTGRLTNLRQLTVDTSWWTRLRSVNQNPDLGGTFENAVPDLAKGQHPAIPQTDAEAALNSDGTIPNHLQAIASTAGFHFAFIEQGAASLYPTERVAEFVVAKLDVTLPSAFRPRKGKEKKTFADYGVMAQRVDENEAILEGPGGAKRLTIKILDQKPSGIYVCIAEPEQNSGETKAQDVVLLKRKDSNALLKGRESFREYAVCPAIGGSESAADSYGGD